MAKRIEFIAPVEAIRGNMSGRQDLRYAENDNKAFEGPQGTRNYARNYSPRFIGAKIGATGLKYFAVKTKTASRLTARSLKAMALLGGAGAIYATLIKRQDLPPYQGLMRLYTYNVSTLGYTGTFRKFTMDFLRQGLIAKVEEFSAQIASISFSFKNPWYDGTMTSGATVKQDVLVKFWMQLAPSAIQYSVEGAKGVAKTGMGWTDLIPSALNVLHLQSDGDHITMDGLYLKDPDDHYVEPAASIIGGAAYTLTDVAPA